MSKKVYYFCYLEKLYEKELLNLRSIIDGKLGVIVPTFKLFTFADLKKHIFWHLFLSTSLNVKGHRELALEQANVVFKEQLPQINKVFKEVLRADNLSTFFVVKIKAGVFSLSSVTEFVKNEDAETEFLFGTIDTVNFAGTTGFHTYSVLALFAILLKEHNVDPKKLQKVRILLIKDFMFYNLEKDSTFKNTQLWTLDLSEVTLEGHLSQPRKPTELDLKSFMDERSLAK